MKMISVASRTCSRKPGAADQDRPAQAAEREAEHRRRRTPRGAAAGSPARISPGSSSRLKPGRARAKSTSRMIGRTSDTIVRALAEAAAERELVGRDGLGARRSVPDRRSVPLRRSAAIAAMPSGDDPRLVAAIVAGPALVAAPPLAHRTATGASSVARTRPLPRARWTTFAIGVRSRTYSEARPMTSVRGGQRGEEPGGGRTGRRRGPCRRPRPRTSCGRRRPRSRAGRAPRANSAASWLPVADRDPGVVGLDPVDEPGEPPPSGRRAGASRGSGRTGAGMPTSPPWARARGDRLVGRQPRRDRLARGTGRSGRRRRSGPPRRRSRSASGASVAARSRASRAPSIRSWSVIARWVSPRRAAVRTSASGEASESNDRPGMGVEIPRRLAALPGRGHGPRPGTVARVAWHRAPRRPAHRPTATGRSPARVGPGRCRGPAGRLRDGVRRRT